MKNPLAIYETSYFSDKITVISTANKTMHMYLIKGDEQDVLIDTGYGFGDLKAVVQKLTNKEIIVINTHGHLDHVGSNDAFDVVYQSPNATSDYSSDFGVDVKNTSKIFHIHDQENIVVAGIPFKILDCSSHSNSDTVIIDERDRIAFTGDIVDKGQNIFVAHSDAYHYKDRVKMHIEGMQKIKANLDLFDIILPSHNVYPIEKSFIDKCIALDQKILNDTAITFPLDHQYMEKSPDAQYFVRVREDDCSVVYRLPRIK